MRMTPSPSDPGLYIASENSRLTALAGTQVDDILGAGFAPFKKISGVLGDTFNSRPRTCPPLVFAGVSITPEEGGGYRIEQPSYAMHLGRLSPDIISDAFRSLRDQVA